MTENIVAEGFGRGYAYSLRLARLYKKLKEAGGTAYEILQNSGLPEFRQQKILWNNDFEEKLRAYDLDGVHYGVALEIYAEHAGEDEPDRIYLCNKDLGRYRLLLELGTIKAGKLWIAFRMLSKAAELGFHCILPAGVEKEVFARYAAIFGTSMQQFEITAWRTENISESGFNLVLLNPVNDAEYIEPKAGLDAMGGTKRIETKLDLYALETAMHVLEQEQQIREYIDPFFYVEHIGFGPWDEEGIPFDFWDENVLALLEAQTEGIFLREVGLALEDFPLCYQKLAYQTAYMAYHYPQLNDVVNEVHKKCNWDNETLGMELDYDVCRSAYWCSEQEVRLLQRRKDIVDYMGIRTVYDAGVVLSESGYIMKTMKKRAGMFVGYDLKQVVVCCRHSW